MCQNLNFATIEARNILKFQFGQVHFETGSSKNCIFQNPKLQNWHFSIESFKLP